MKTFKIGEYAIVITAHVTPREVTIQAKTWDTKQVIASRVLESWAPGDHRYTWLIEALDQQLTQWTSSYHSGKVLDYIKSQLK